MNSLKLRIIILIGAALLLNAWYFSRRNEERIRRSYREATEEILVDLAVVLAASEDIDQLDSPGVLTKVAERLNQGEKRVKAKIYDQVKEGSDIALYVTDAKGVVTFDSHRKSIGQDFSTWRNVNTALRGDYGSRTSKNPETRESVLHVTVPLFNRESGQVKGTLTVEKPTSFSNRLIRASQKGTLELLTIVSVGTLGVAGLLTLLIISPLSKLTAYARSYADRAPKKVSAFLPEEFSVLQQAFDGMRDELEGKQYVQNYVATISHELKSPLTGIRSSLEVIEDSNDPEVQAHFLSTIHQETIRLQSLIDNLLSLTHLERLAEVELDEAIVLADLINEVIECVKPAAALKELIWEVNVPRAHSIVGNSFWLKRALLNIIENAVQFAPTNSTLTIGSASDDGVISVTVSDEGPGIPDWAVEKVFDRFFSLPRPDSGRKSSGLGLALAKEIIVNHGGSVTLTNRNQSAGTVAEVRFNAKGANL